MKEGQQAGYWAAYTPELVRVLRAGYGRHDFAADVMAGITVAVLALPLSLAIAIGSGADPSKGIISAIIGGAIISGLGGTRFQIGGPAAAFIVVISGIVAAHGYDGLLGATVMAGLMLMTAALFGFGEFVKYVPGPVILGFTSGLGIVILVGQIKDFLGLSGAVPAEFIGRLEGLWAARSSFNTFACITGLVSLAIVLGVKRVRPKWPGLLFAIAGASALAWAFGWDVATIGSRFGEMPRGLPLPAWPQLGPARLLDLVPTALTMALLIGVESLMSAVTADAIAGTRHRPNTEMLAQGFANVTAALFTGLPVTGVIARTGTNIHAGAHSPLSGIIHAVMLLVFVALLAPLVAFLALPTLAAVLMTVAWRLVDHHEIQRFLRTAPRDDAVICVLTLLLTVFVDLTAAISAGVVGSALLFMHRMAEQPGNHAAPHDPARHVDGVRMLVFRGPLFFGQSARVADALRATADEDHHTLLLDMAEVPLIDATAITVLEDLADDCAKANRRIVLAGLSPQPLAALTKSGFLGRNGIVGCPTLDDAVALARQRPAD